MVLDVEAPEIEGHRQMTEQGLADGANLRGLLIPYAFGSSGERVSPREAARGHSYQCPECRERLVFRQGKVRVPHFAHYRTPESCRFMSEGWLHIAAKHAIFHAVSEWVEGHGPAPQLLRRCETCRQELWQPLPGKVRTVVMELRLPSGRVADLVLGGESGPVAVVEIYDTHAVGEEKEKDLCGIPWVELSATEALRDPIHWHARTSRGLKSFRCRCASAVRMRIVERGCAVHVDGCPVRARVWRGKPYANVIDDCSACEHSVGMIYVNDTKEDSEAYLLCDGFGKARADNPVAFQAAGNVHVKGTG